MSARVLVIGLDAAEAPLLERWAADGTLPTVARLREHGTSVQLANCMDTLPGAIWPELATGIAGTTSGLYFHPRQLHTGEAVVRPVTEDECRGEDQFWATAARDGARVCVIDVPQSAAVPGMDGLQLFEWGLHDRQFDVRSDPPDVLADIRSRWGDHPVEVCDLHHGRTDEGYLSLLDGLLAGARAKTEFATELLEREDWDLFVCCWAESHCVGHQFEHFADPTHPRFDPDADPRLQGAWPSVYQAIDAGVGALIDAAGPDATVLVVASHGMGPYIAGYHLVPTVLERLGLGPQQSRVAAAPTRLPSGVRSVLRTVIPERIRRRRVVATGKIHTRTWLESPTCRVAYLENNRVAALRLNLVGREPHGCVQPGTEADALIDELRRELGALRLPGTDTPIVRDVYSRAEFAGPHGHPDLPDLVVVFRRDLGPIDACWSERVGLVEHEIGSPTLPRTGDHTDASRLWAMGPGIPEGAHLEPADVLDVAPTVLSLLGTPAPGTVEGHPLDLTAGSTSPLGGRRVVGGRALPDTAHTASPT